MLSTSTAVAGAATPEGVLRQAGAIVSSESASRSSSSVPNDSMTQAITFSSGNPRIEETRGVVHIYLNDRDVSTSAGPSPSSKLPVGRKPLVCVLGIPNHMTYADFCRFCGSFVHHILEMRIVRNDGPEDGICVLMSFDSQDSTDNFYSHFNGRPFSSLEDEICRVLFALDVQYTGSKTHALASSASSNESPSCPVCLEVRSGYNRILTTVCNHSFHCSCISKWTDSSCPVCRYCQQQPEKSTCFVCQTSENLWMCVICGFVGCGRYKQGHAIIHWKETEHCYSLELETQRVWDYAGDNYVHRLIQSKTDGELVELNTNCPHSSGCGSCECSDFGFSEAILNSKVEAIKVEYNELLTTQLENQKQYFESLIQEAREDTEREISEAVERASLPKFQKMQAQLNRCVQEKKFLDDLNENLLKNQEIWEAKIVELEEREKKVLEVKDDLIQELEKQLRSLMACLEGGSSTEQFPSTSNEITDCTSLRITAEPDRNKTTGQKKAN